MKKIFAIVLMLCFVVSMFSVTVFATTGDEAALESGGVKKPTNGGIKVGSVFGEGSLAIIISVIALAVSVVAMTVTLVYNKKNGSRLENKNEDGNDEE